MPSYVTPYFTVCTTKKVYLEGLGFSKTFNLLVDNIL